MTLEQLMAFTVSDDHARQEQVWEAISHSWSKEPHQIRRMLTETAVRASDIFDALISTLEDTRLEPDLDDLLWSTVNVFHRATERIARELDDKEQAQKRSQRQQDGSEVKSVELERQIAEGKTLIERQARQSS